jgi:hypothetical protein
MRPGSVPDSEGWLTVHVVSSVYKMLLSTKAEFYPSSRSFLTKLPKVLPGLGNSMYCILPKVTNV